MPPDPPRERCALYVCKGKIPRAVRALGRTNPTLCVPPPFFNSWIRPCSPCVYVAVEAALIREMTAIFSMYDHLLLVRTMLLTMLMEQKTVTNPAVMHGLCAMTKH